MSANSGIGRRACSESVPGAVVRRGLVEVGEQQQVVGAVADVGDVDERAAPDLALHRDEPALHLARVVVLRHVGDVGGERIEARRIGQPRRIALLRRPEIGLRRRLHDDGVDDLRAVDRQHVGAAGAMEVDVADAVAAANTVCGVKRVGEAEARAEVVAIGLERRAILRASRPARSPSSAWPDRSSTGCCPSPPTASRTRSAARGSASAVVHAPVVLQVGEVHVLPQVGDEDVAERVGRAQRRT